MVGRIGLAALLVATLRTSPPAAASDPRVEYRDHRVDVRADAVPLRRVLDALAAVTGAEIHGQPLEDRPVSTEIRGMPLDDVLHRLLGSQNFTVSYGRDGRPRAVRLLGGPEAPPPPSDRPTAAGVPVEPVPVAAPALQFPLELSRAIQRARPVPVPEALAEALGSDRATIPRLFDLAMRDDDGLLRVQAIESILGAFERQGRLRRAFLRTLYGLDDAGLQAVVGGESGPRLVGLLEYLAAHSREPALQKKTTLILEQLRSVQAQQP